jgi:hypothetical protein
MSHDDPTVTDPSLYKLVFENERVRVLEYRDKPGDRTQLHRHPDSVMVTLSAFQRRVTAEDRSVDVELAVGEVRWLGAQQHLGENIGGTPTHSIFVELKEPAATSAPTTETPLGPSARQR